MAIKKNTDILSTIDLFSDLSQKELKAIGKLMTPIDLKAGKVLMSEDTTGREAFIILEGDASVWRGDRLVSSVGPGAVLGEMALIAGTPRTATVKAETDMVVEVLDRREFLSLLDTNSNIARKLLVTSLRRLHDLQPALLS